MNSTAKLVHTCLLRFIRRSAMHNYCQGNNNNGTPISPLSPDQRMSGIWSLMLTGWNGESWLSPRRFLVPCVQSQGVFELRGFLAHTQKGQQAEFDTKSIRLMELMATFKEQKLIFCLIYWPKTVVRLFLLNKVTACETSNYLITLRYSHYSQNNHLLKPEKPLFRKLNLRSHVTGPEPSSPSCGEKQSNKPSAYFPELAPFMWSV